MTPWLDYIVDEPAVQIVLLFLFAVAFVVPFVTYNIRRHHVEKEGLKQQAYENEHRRKMVESGLLEHVRPSDHQEH